MKCQILFSRKNEKNITSLSSAEFVHSMVSVNEATYLLCFRHLSESLFLLDALQRRSKFANFCHDVMGNHLS